MVRAYILSRYFECSLGDNSSSSSSTVVFCPPGSGYPIQCPPSACTRALSRRTKPEGLLKLIRGFSCSLLFGYPRVHASALPRRCATLCSACDCNAHGGSTGQTCPCSACCNTHPLTGGQISQPQIRFHSPPGHSPPGHSPPGSGSDLSKSLYFIDRLPRESFLRLRGPILLSKTVASFVNILLG